MNVMPHSIMSIVRATGTRVIFPWLVPMVGCLKLPGLIMP